MSSTVSVAPLSLEIRPSRYLAFYVLGVYTAAGLVVIALPVSAWFKCALLGGVFLFCIVTYRTRVSLRNRRAVVGLSRQTDGAWQLRFADGAAQQARLLQDSYLHPELLVLNFRFAAGKRRSVVLVRDSTDSVGLRHLRVALALGVRDNLG